MTANDIKRMVSTEIGLQQSNRRFGQNAVPVHLHDGLDSSFSFSPTVAYTGFVPSSGDVTGASTNGFVFFPAGWTTGRISGAYFVLHNLGTKMYSVTVQQTGGLSIGTYYAGTSCSRDFFLVVFFNGAGIRQDVDFEFNLVQINSRLPFPPKYNASNP